MKIKGKSLLRWMGVLEIILAVGGFFLIRWILSQDLTQVDGFYASAATGSLWALMTIYGTLAVQLIAGILGVALAGNLKQSGICYVFGLLLILVQSAAYFNQSFNLQMILQNTLQLLPAALYFYGAALNQQQNKAAQK